MQQLSDELEKQIARAVERLDREQARREQVAGREQAFLERTLLVVEELIDEVAGPDAEPLRRELRRRFERTQQALVPEPFPTDLVDGLRALVVDIRHGHIRD